MPGVAVRDKTPLRVWMKKLKDFLSWEITPYFLFSAQLTMLKGKS